MMRWVKWHQIICSWFVNRGNSSWIAAIRMEKSWCQLSFCFLALLCPQQHSCEKWVATQCWCWSCCSCCRQLKTTRIVLTYCCEPIVTTTPPPFPFSRLSYLVLFLFVNYYLFSAQPFTPHLKLTKQSHDSYEKWKYFPWSLNKIWWSHVIQYRLPYGVPIVQSYMVNTNYPLVTPSFLV